MFTAYKISIEIGLLNTASRGLNHLGQDFKKAELDVGRLQKRIASLNHLFKGGLYLGASRRIASLFKAPYNAAREYANQLSQLNILGLKQAEIANAVSMAWSIHRKVPTATAASNLHMYRELRGSFGAGHEQEALSMVPQLQRTAAIIQSVTGRAVEGIGRDMVRAVEFGMNNALDKAALVRQSKKMLQAIVGMGGTLDVSDFHMAFKMSKGAAARWSDEFKYLYFPLVMQEFKTSRKGGVASAGTAMYALNRAAINQIVPKHAYQTWMEAGLIDPNKVVFNPHSRTTSKLLPGAVRGQDVLQKNPLEYARLYMKPAVERLMKARRISRGQAEASLFGFNQNVLFSSQQLMNKAVQFERDRKLIEQADGLQAYNKLLKTNPEMAEIALASRWRDLMARLGFEVLPTVIDAFRALTKRLENLTDWYGKHKTAAKGTMWAVGGAAGLVGLKGIWHLAKWAFGGIGGQLKSVWRLAPVVSSVLRTVGAGLWNVVRLATPVGRLIAVLVGLGVAFYAAYRHGDEIKSYLLEWGHWFRNWFRATFPRLDAWLHGQKAQPSALKQREVGAPPLGPILSRLPDWMLKGIVVIYAVSPGTLLQQSASSRARAYGKTTAPIAVQNTIHLNGKQIARDTKSYFYQDVTRQTEQLIWGSANPYDGAVSLAPPTLNAAYG